MGRGLYQDLLLNRDCCEQARAGPSASQGRDAPRDYETSYCADLEKVRKKKREGDEVAGG